MLSLGSYSYTLAQTTDVAKYSEWSAADLDPCLFFFWGGGGGGGAGGLGLGVSGSVGVRVWGFRVQGLFRV